MPRYKLTIEYDGTPYVGWQMQENGPSVQGHIARAARAFSGEATIPRGAGRTDAGVHALGQVAHLDLARDWPANVVANALNAHLRPEPISILACTRVAEDFDARFSAVARTYRYRLVSRSGPLALDRGRAWHLMIRLDDGAMRDAAAVLTGRHDFTTFRARECQAASPLKTLDRLDVTRDGEEIRIEAHAKSFLHTQVRSMAGALKLVGEGRWTPADVSHALSARKRTACPPLAPPRGLYLLRVDYPIAETPAAVRP